MSAIAAQVHIEENTAKAREALADIQQNATEAQVEMQALLQQLRPSALEHTSFAEAVRIQAQALEYRSGARVRIELEEFPASDRCPPARQEAVFRKKALSIWKRSSFQGGTGGVITRNSGTASH